MEIKAVTVLNFPRELVWKTYRDKIVDMVPYLPNIEKIEVRSREDVPPYVVRFDNLWYAKADIPKVAMGIVKPDMLRWVDYAQWNEDTYTCDWRLETFFFKDYIKVAGRNTYTEPAPGKTQLELRGDMHIDVASMPGIPRFLASTIQPPLERFIRDLITPNLVNIGQGLDEYLKKHQV